MPARLPPDGPLSLLPPRPAKPSASPQRLRGRNWRQTCQKIWPTDWQQAGQDAGKRSGMSAASRRHPGRFLLLLSRLHDSINQFFLAQRRNPLDSELFCLFPELGNSKLFIFFSCHKQHPYYSKMVTVQILHIRPWRIRPGSCEKHRYLKIQLSLFCSSISHVLQKRQNYSNSIVMLSR